jgi:hypothetical protein
MYTYEVLGKIPTHILSVIYQLAIMECSMKNLLLVLTLNLFALAFAPMIEAKPAIKSISPNVIKSKAKGSIPFYRASENDLVIFLNGSTTASYMPLTFSQHTHVHSSGIEPQKNHHEFVLEKGSYQIAFNGTFLATSVAEGGIALVDLGIQVGSEVIGFNTQSIEASFDNTQILNFTEVLHFDKKTTVQIVARNRVVATTANVLHRSMSIVKLD